MSPGRRLTVALVGLFALVVVGWFVKDNTSGAPPKVDKPVDRPQEVIRGDVPFERELIEQRPLRHLPRSHHRLRPPLASR